VRQRNAGSLHVARMYPVPVTQGELYYLRKLLTVVSGTSFSDMRAYNGETYATYREAAEARGIVGVEEEYSQALGVVASSKSRPSDLRHTFVVIAVTGGEGVPVQDLYRKFRYYMAMDLDVRGRVQPPGRSPAGSEEECAVYHLLPVREYVEDNELDLDNYPVHEYHLLRVLEDLLDRNFSRSLENVGLPTLQSFATMLRGGLCQQCSCTWSHTCVWAQGQWSPLPCSAPTLTYFERNTPTNSLHFSRVSTSRCYVLLPGEGLGRATWTTSSMTLTRPSRTSASRTCTPH
jgi:hypothetical protein